MKNYESIGFKINVQALAAGIYEMIKKHPDGACMTMGMFPAGIMESFEKGLKDKIPDTFYSKVAGEVINWGKDIRKDITHQVCTEILALACRERVCIV